MTNISEPLHSPELLPIEQIVSHAVQEQLLVLNCDLVVLAASESFYTTFQTTPCDTVGKKLVELGQGQWNIPSLLTLLTEVPKQDRESNHLAIELISPPLGAMQVSARLLSDAGDQFAPILLSIVDITRQKRNEAEAMVLANRYRTILASIGKAVIVTDPESRITFMNPVAEKLIGWDKNDAAGRDLIDIFHIENAGSSQTVDGLIATVLHGRAAIELRDPTVLIARDGGEWPIDGNAAPIVDAAGRVSGVALVFQDVTNQRAEEQNLEISEVRYRRLFESAHDGIMILDAVTAKILDVNPFMAVLLDYPREHFWGKELWEIGVFKDAEASKTAMATLQRLGRIRYEDLPLEHKNGRHIPVEFVSNVYREGRRNVI